MGHVVVVVVCCCSLPLFCTWTSYFTFRIRGSGEEAEVSCEQNDVCDCGHDSPRGVLLRCWEDANLIDACKAPQGPETHLISEFFSKSRAAAAAHSFAADPA